MIASIRGIVLEKQPDCAVIDVSGLGYKVFCTPETLAALSTDTEAHLWTHLAVRETALDLYGFHTHDELRLFELLTSVSGIGPKSAIGILAAVPTETLRGAVAQGNASYLTNVSGIGKKTAERIVIELQEKVGLGEDGATSALRGDEDALEALRAMGYATHEARDALKQVDTAIEDGSARLREALKILGSK